MKADAVLSKDIAIIRIAGTTFTRQHLRIFFIMSVNKTRRLITVVYVGRQPIIKNIGTQIYDIDVDYVNDDINSPVMRKKLVDWSRDKLCKLTVAICVYEPDLGLSMGLSLPPDVYESDARVLIRQEKLNGLGQFIHNDFTGRFKNVKIFGMHAGGIRKKVLDDRLAAYINYSYVISSLT